MPFAGEAQFRVLDCADLAVFKAFYARPKDVVDVATMAAAGAIDAQEVRGLVEGLRGADRDRFFERVIEALEQMR